MTRIKDNIRSKSITDSTDLKQKRTKDEPSQACLQSFFAFAFIRVDPRNPRSVFTLLLFNLWFRKYGYPQVGSSGTCISSALQFARRE